METKHKYNGLTDDEVLKSRKEFGINLLTPPEKDPWWKLFLEKFEDPIIRILMIAAVISIIVGAIEGKYYEGIGIILAILLATTLAFLNEFKANKEFEILNKVNDDIPVKVIRNGIYTTVPKRDIVVGDIVIIETGEEVPADGEVLEAVSLQISESKLTGESVPVTKTPKGSSSESKKENAYPAEVVLSSTSVMNGHGIIKITSVGNSTEVAKTVIASMEETNDVTPLNKQLDKLSQLIGVIGFGVAALTYAALSMRGIFTSAIKLETPQWGIVISAFVAIIVMMIPVWLPIFYDTIDIITKKENDRPEWIEDAGIGLWIKTMVIGLVIFGISTLVGNITHAYPLNPAEWTSKGEAGYEAMKHFLEYFMIAVTIIVVAVPEGLAMSVTLSLAYSMRKMTASNNLVRKMHACETIGAATVICTDKTGTLTMNEMRIHEIHFPSLGKQTITENSEQERFIIEAMAVNSTANLDKSDPANVKPLGNPTEAAFVLWLDNNKADYIVYRDEFSISYQIPFSTEKKYMATAGTSKVTGKGVIYVKGAPEVVLAKCSGSSSKKGLEKLDSSMKSSLEKEIIAFQARGMRTLGFAYKNVDIKNCNVEESVEKDLIWLGFAAISDPVRPDVPKAIQDCRNAGIDVKIITGDNPLMAKEIGKQIGSIDLHNENATGTVLTGPEFNNLSDEQLRATLPNLKVLSRAKPLDKLRTVKMLKTMGHVVAVTGDGTNDAPALNYADVGLSMGKTGTSVAKEASDIILLDDSFTSIVNAVMWGRSLYQNIQRFVLFQLTINVVALTIALLGPFIGISLPFTVTQMLWINLIMDTFAALALATEPPHWDVMKNKPRNPESFIITPSMAKSILGYGVIFVAILIIMLLNMKKNGEITTYDLTFFFTMFVMMQFWNLFNAKCLGLNSSVFKGLLENKSFTAIASAILFGQILVVQFGGEIFRTVPLSLKDWGIIIVSSSSILIFGEILRFVRKLTSKA